MTSVDAAVKHLDFRLYKTQAAEIGGWGPVKDGCSWDLLKPSEICGTYET